MHLRNGRPPASRGFLPRADDTPCTRLRTKWQSGPLPSELRKPRSWRTRVDPFAEIWEKEVLPLLARDAAGILQATTVIDLLEERSPGRFGHGQLRTLQRRIRDWRALHGPQWRCAG